VSKGTTDVINETNRKLDKARAMMAIIYYTVVTLVVASYIASIIGAIYIYGLIEDSVWSNSNIKNKRKDIYCRLAKIYAFLIAFSWIFFITFLLIGLENWWPAFKRESALAEFRAHEYWEQN
jgi:hypothetical protein